jgi:hypothetical protein
MATTTGGGGGGCGSVDASLDYVVGRVLPHTLRVPTSYAARVVHFTTEQARVLRLTGLPLRLNHAEESWRDREAAISYVIGRVAGSRMAGTDRRVCLAIASAASPQAAFAAKSVANGTYDGISLGHDVRQMRHEARQYILKHPTEISLCREGLRPGSRIEHFFPSHRTLSLLNTRDLLTFASRYGYEGRVRAALPSLPPSSVGAPAAAYAQFVHANRPRYIDALHAAVVSRRNTILPSEMTDAGTAAAVAAPAALQDRLPPPRINASDTAAAAAAPAPPGTEQQQQQQQQQRPPEAAHAAAEAAAPAAVPDGQAASPEGGGGGDAAPSAADLADPRKMALHVRDMELKMAAMKAENDRMLSERQAAAQEQRDKAAREANAALEAFVQHAITLYNPQEIEVKRAYFADRIRADPVNAIPEIEAMKEMAVRASSKMAEENARVAQAMHHNKRLLSDQNDRFYERIAGEITSARSNYASTSAPLPSYLTNATAGAAAAASRAAGAPFDSRFLGTQAAPAAAAAAAAAVPTPAAPAPGSIAFTGAGAPSAPAQAPPGGGGGGNPAVPQVVRASADTDGGGAWAKAEFEAISREIGRIATYDEVAHGMEIETVPGRMKASAAGTMVPETRLVVARAEPVEFNWKHFAPDFWDKICQMGENARDRGIVLRPTMTGGKAMQATGAKPAWVGVGTRAPMM